MKKITKLIFGIFVCTIFSAIISGSTVSANENTAGPQIINRATNVGNIYHHRIVSIQMLENPGNVVEWNMFTTSRVFMRQDQGLPNQRWVMFYNNEDDTYQIVGGPLNAGGTFRAAYLSANGQNIDTRWNINSDKWRIFRFGSHANGNTVYIQNVSENRTMTYPAAWLGNPLILRPLEVVNGGTSQRFIIRVLGNA
ncbi:hypothetical protein [Enterococcus mundtii]|uniref:hypothetical protein n=1 Tax=Enterococcus mundtii TaxID=53346 RepID=UPI0007EEB5CC|nr:hypothetical protein [Enterococcus mundtii]OBS63217.1 hypothetical protein AX758_07800 [Enterococcus mundtii]